MMTPKRLSFLFLSLIICLVISAPAAAQDKLAYVDSEYIYSQYPEFATAQQQLDRKTDEWTQDLEFRQTEIDDLFRDYQARELLYTQDERQRRQEEIMLAEEDLASRRMQYFGPEGELYRLQDQLLRPIQEKVLIAIEAIAQAEGYDYVFDRSGDYVFLYTDERYDISDEVLRELGIDVQQPGGAAIGSPTAETVTPGSSPASEQGGRALPTGGQSRRGGQGQ